MKIALLQMVSSPDEQDNLAQSRALLEEAATGGAELAVLPEYFCLLGRHEGDKVVVGGTLPVLAPEDSVTPVSTHSPGDDPSARAYNRCYAAAPAQGGLHVNGRRTWGHSMVIDPWSTTLALREDGAACVLADLDPARVETSRAQLPSMAHRVL